MYKFKFLDIFKSLKILILVFSNFSYSVLSNKIW